MQEHRSQGQHPLSLEEMPKDDRFLSQVLEFLRQYFPDEHFTGNIVQNYIKSEVISKPIQGKKRGYTRTHLIQLVFLSYMRPILTTDEIKKVFALAFNEINQPEDDIISWEAAYQIFLQIYADTERDQAGRADGEDRRINEILATLQVADKDFEPIRQFIKVLILITRASNIKRDARAIVNGSSRSLEKGKIRGWAGEEKGRVSPESE